MSAEPDHKRRVVRRLVAIVAVDVVGYSALMGADEEGTLERLSALKRELIAPKLGEHRGRVFKTMGDGLLIEFPSAVDAVACAVAMQAAVAERNADLPRDGRFELRIGINIGDVIVEDRDLHGDAVNIAARLESFAEPGGICLSGEVYTHVRGRLPFAFVYLGERTLKNIAYPVAVFRPARPGAQESAHPSFAPPLPERPSIAVMPFQNFSNDPSQDYFADGMVEDIITALSRLPSLMVIARNSSFTYKGKTVDVKQVGRELGVRYILEGSVRKAKGRVRISGQLVDTTTGGHIWADHFDESLEDIFELQDRVASSVVGAIEPSLRAAEVDRIKRKRPDNLDAYDHVLRGLSYSYVPTRESQREALAHFYKAIELDPTYGFAYGCAAISYVFRLAYAWFDDMKADAAEGVRLARLAAEIGHDDPQALRSAGLAFAFIGGEKEKGATLIDRTLSLTPNSAIAWYSSAFVRVLLGDAPKALDHIACAIRLSPRDPRSHEFYTIGAHAHLIADHLTEALAWADTATSLQPAFLAAWRLKASLLGLLDRLDEAQAVIAHLHEVEPSLTLSTATARTPLLSRDLARLIEGLRKAGLPE